MATAMRPEWAYDDGDVDANGAVGTPHLNELIEGRPSRRQALFGGVSAIGAATLLGGCGSDGSDGPDLTVSAGEARATSSGRVVAPTGAVSGGAATNSAWVQVSGPPVSLTLGPDAASVSFVAPSVASATPLGFRFSAVNASGPANADATVTVNPSELGFAAVPKSLADRVVVPAGYSVAVLYRLGDPIDVATGAYANNGSDGGFSARAGDHHDGMSWLAWPPPAPRPTPPTTPAASWRSTTRTSRNATSTPTAPRPSTARGRRRRR